MQNNGSPAAEADNNTNNNTTTTMMMISSRKLRENSAFETQLIGTIIDEQHNLFSYHIMDCNYRLWMDGDYYLCAPFCQWQFYGCIYAVNSWKPTNSKVFAKFHYFVDIFRMRLCDQRENFRTKTRSVRCDVSNNVCDGLIYIFLADV